jgi:microcystin-dependent protein
MAKTKVSQWDSVAANNTEINSININEGCPPSTINNAIRETMAQIKNWQDGSSGDGWTSTGTITAASVLNVTGSLQLDGAVGTSGQVLVSSGSSATPTWGDAFVTGMIMLWSGSTGTIPSGWALCNGSSGTPDLRDRFVVGAGSTYAVDATGGSADATLPSHTHTGTTNGGGSHNHTIPHNLVQNVSSGGNIDQDNELQTRRTISGQVTGNIGNHTHSFTTASSGTSATNANLPPYYALAYIMKL